MGGSCGAVTNEEERFVTLSLSRGAEQLIHPTIINTVLTQPIIRRKIILALPFQIYSLKRLYEIYQK
jgi:hypothetical protein